MIRSLLTKIFNNKDLSELLKGSIAAFILKITGYAFGYVFILIITKIYFQGEEGASAFGIYSLSTVVLSVAAIVSKLGFDTYLVRMAAERNKEGNLAAVKSIYRKTITIAFPLSLAVCIAAFYCAPLIASLFNNTSASLPSAIKYISISIVGLTVLDINAAILRGLKMIKSFSFYSHVARFTFAAFILFSFYLFDISFGLITPVVAYMIAVITAALISMIQVAIVFKQTETQKEQISTGAVLSVSFPMLLVTSMLLINGWADTVVLGVFESERVVGIYNVALKLATANSFAITAINAIAAPKFSELFFKGEMERFRVVINQTTKMIFFTSLPVLIMFISFPRFFLGIFGHEFETGMFTLICLTLGNFINACSGSVGYILQMTGHQRVFQFIILGSTIINITLNLLLVGPYGMKGVAVASMVSMSLWNIASAIYIKKKLNVSTYYFPFLKK